VDLLQCDIPPTDGMFLRSGMINMCVLVLNTMEEYRQSERSFSAKGGMPFPENVGKEDMTRPLGDSGTRAQKKSRKCTKHIRNTCFF